MTLDQLRYFLATSRYQHLGKAAKQLAISPSAVSGAIAALEAELGCDLFERKGRAIRLTPAGMLLQKRAGALLGQADSIALELRNTPDQLQGHYRLGASHALCAPLLAQAWFGIQDEHPELSSEIQSMGSGELLRRLRQGELDAGLCFSPQRQPSIRHLELHRGRLQVVLRKGHPLLKAPAKRRLDRLSEFAAVLHKSSAGIEPCENHPALEEVGIRPRVELWFDDDTVAARRVMASDSWALMPDLVLRQFPKGLQALPLPSSWNATYTVCLLSAESRGTIPPLSLLEERLRGLLSSH